VVHTSNPSYSGGSNQEDWFKTSLGKYFERPYLKKNPSLKRAGGVALQGEGPEPQKKIKTWAKYGSNVYNPSYIY
jgi:hypothetical protein